MSAFQKPTGPKRLAVLFFGDSKAGKSRSALSFPKPAVIDYEDGATDWFANDFEFESAHVKSLVEGEALLGDLRGCNFKTLVEDGLSAAHYRLMDAHKDDDGKVKSQAWPQIKLTERSHALKMRDCGLHYVATAREKAEYYKAGEVMRNGKAATGKEFAVKSAAPDYDEDITHEFDLVIRLFKENGKFLGQITHTRSAAKLPVGRVLENVTYRSIVELLKADVGLDLDRAIEQAIKETKISRADSLALTLRVTNGKTNDYRECSTQEKQAIFDALAHHKKQGAA